MISYKETQRNHTLNSWSVVQEQISINTKDKTNWNEILGVSLSKFCYSSHAINRTATDTINLIYDTCPFLTPEQKKKVYIGVNARYAEMGSIDITKQQMEGVKMENETKPREFKEVVSNTWEYEKEGDFLQGVYLSKEEEVGENKSNVYQIQDDKGDIIGVWGSTVLDHKMKLVSSGQYVKITYLGKKDSPNRKDKQYKDFKVEKDISQS